MRYDPTDTSDGIVPPAPEGRPNEFYIAAWRRTFDFKGVASRTEFWSFVLINFAFVLCLSVGAVVAEEPLVGVLGFAILIFCLLTAIPFLSVSVRRFRDVTGTGWFTLTLPLLYPPYTGSVIGTLMGPSLGERENTDSTVGYGGVWRKTPDWLSRSTRTEYWMFALFSMLAFLGAFIALAVLNSATGFPVSLFRSWGYVVGFPEVAYGSMVVVSMILSTPALPLLVRRVRDATGSGWVTLFLFPVSLVSPFLFLVITVSPSRDAERLGRLSGGYWDVWRKTADYVGVARRGEFWPFTLINGTILIAGAAFVVVLYYSDVNSFGNLSQGGQVLIPVFILIWVVAYFALSVPWFSLAVRRVRDATASGWWLLTSLIPFIGWIIALVLFLLPSRKASSSSGPGHSDEPMQPQDDVAQYEEDDPWNSQQDVSSNR